MDALQGHVVRAIDVGYGNVKYSTQHKDIISEVICEMFPSLSPVATERSLSDNLVRGLDTITVNVNDVNYEVGPQAALAQGAFDDSSILHKDFCLTDAYMARTKGALYYMMGSSSDGVKLFDGNLIDVLILGLPVSSYRDKELKKALRDKVKGAHELPNGLSVIIEQVLVMPQPMGALFDYAHNHGMLDAMQEQINLIIDPGFNTFDWLLSAGLVPIESRTDSVNRGMSAVIEAIAKAIDKDMKWKTDISKLSGSIAEYFNSGKPVICYQTQVDPMKYLSAAQPVINQAVEQLTRSIGNSADIQNVILAGGGASFYLPTIQAKLPLHKIMTATNPVYSNVRGFQRAGEQQILIKLRNANKANQK